MSDDMQSLEDMLAALEMPSNSSSYAFRPSTTGTTAYAQQYPSHTDDQIESIEDFLSNIMTDHAPMEAPRAPSTYQARPGASSYQPNNGYAAQQDYGRGPSTYQQPAARAPSTYNRGPAQQAGYAPQPTQPTQPAQPAQGRGYAPSGGYGGGAPGGYGAQGGYGGGGGGSEGDDQLTQQGFQRHNNRGKWIKSGQGKASDFRIRGTTSSKEGLTHSITVRPLDDYGNPAPLDLPFEVIGVILTHRQTGQNIQPWLRDNGDATYDVAFFASQAGVVRMEIKICNHPMFDIDIQIDGDTSLWVAQPRLPAEIGQSFVIDIVSADGSRPDGVAPFEVKAMGDCTDLKLLNNGDGTYMFTCVPQSAGHLTIQITLHDQPIQDSPVSVQVGAKQTHYVRQVAEPPPVANTGRGTSHASHASHAPAPAPAASYDRNSYYGAPSGGYAEPDYSAAPSYGGGYDDGGYANYGSGPVYDSAQDYGTQTYGYDYGGQGDMREVTNDDLNRLLDELGSGL